MTLCCMKYVAATPFCDFFFATVAWTILTFCVWGCKKYVVATYYSAGLLKKYAVATYWFDFVEKCM